MTIARETKVARTGFAEGGLTSGFDDGVIRVADGLCGRFDLIAQNRELLEKIMLKKR
jgi:hypothetical protein